MTTLLAEAGTAWASVEYVHSTGTYLGAGPSSHFDVQPKGTPAVQQSYDMRVATIGRGNTQRQFARGWIKGANFYIDVIHIDTKLYLRGNAAYYRLLGPKAVAVTGRWLVDAATEFPEYGTDTPQGTVVMPQSNFLPGLATLGPLAIPPLYGVSVTRASERVLDGKSVIPIHFGSRIRGISGDLYLSATGAPLPVRNVSEASFLYPGFTANYSQYNVPFTVKAPIGAIDIHSVQVP